MNEIEIVIKNIKSKDRKVRYAALEAITKLSNSKQKQELLTILHEKAASNPWEDRYVAMYALSRFRWRSGTFADFSKTYQQVLHLLEDEDGRVRVTAFNALEHFRGYFIAFIFGEMKQFEQKEVASLWLNSLFSLWQKTKSIKDKKKKYFMMKCIDTLYRPDMEEYLSPQDYRKYMEIWKKLLELNEAYNESRGLL